MKIELSQDEVSVIVNALVFSRHMLERIDNRSPKNHLPDTLDNRIKELLEVERKFAPYMESTKENES